MGTLKVHMFALLSTWLCGAAASDLTAQTLVPDSLWRAPKRGVLSGLAIRAGQPAFGVPWHALTLSSWGTRGTLEWSIGGGTEGSEVWRETQAWLGAGKTWNPQLRTALVVNVGMASWPEVQRRVPFLDMRAEANHREDWGEVRMEVHATLGRGQHFGGVAEEGVVRTARGAYGWTAWWTPNLPLESAGLPALGWSHGGVWRIAWGLDASWWDEMRPWRPVHSRIFLKWSWPEGRFELSWMGSVAPKTRRAGASTRQSESIRPPHQGSLGVLFGGGRAARGGSWWWMWDRTEAENP